MNQETARWIVMAGLFITAAGLVFYFFGRHLHWLGRLPGDIRMEREGFSFYFPLTTMILLSLLLNGLVRLAQYLLK